MRIAKLLHFSDKILKFPLFDFLLSPLDIKFPLSIFFENRLFFFKQFTCLLSRFLLFNFEMPALCA